jgi:anthranilate/para-aminobenzoate synthase component II
MNIFLLDNYDSFTYNLHALVSRSSGIHARIIKLKNELTFDEFTAH